MLSRYRISGTPDRVHINGDVQQNVVLNADGFFRALLVLPPPRCLDLLRIATGIFAVDRITKRKKRRDNEHGLRQLRVVSEVRDHDFWGRPDIVDLLSAILSFLTDDDWSFDFERAQRAPGDLGHQDFLALPHPFPPRYAALYSGGLDSASGLANRLLEGADDFLLVTVGHQSGLHRRVKNQFDGNKQNKGLKTLFSELNGVSPRILHSTLTTSLRGGKAIRMRQQEPTQRTRAFLFCSAAAIAADAYKLDVVEMFENGVGAINLPLMTGMLGNGLSTRGAHPTFLQMMSALSTHVTRRNIRFVLPFEARTRAEMLKHLAAVPGLGIWAQESRSCVHTALRQTGKTHCGRCPACIERRQAFAVAGINEKLDVYQTNLLVDSLSDQDEADYLDLYQIDATNWVAGNASVERRMNNHFRLTDVSPDQDQRIQELQLRHAREVLRTFGDPFSRHRNSTQVIEGYGREV